MFYRANQGIGKRAQAVSSCTLDHLAIMALGKHAPQWIVFFLPMLYLFDPVVLIVISGIQHPG